MSSWNWPLKKKKITSSQAIITVKSQVSWLLQFVLWTKTGLKVKAALLRRLQSGWSFPLINIYSAATTQVSQTFLQMLVTAASKAEFLLSWSLLSIDTVKMLINQEVYNAIPGSDMYYEDKWSRGKTQNDEEFGQRSNTAWKTVGCPKQR